MSFSTLMDDLKSYAEHRQSQTVDMKDVLLYLQRINFAGKGSSTNETEIDRISELAQKFLPLENLIALIMIYMILFLHKRKSKNKKVG